MNLYVNKMPHTWPEIKAIWCVASNCEKR